MKKSILNLAMAGAFAMGSTMIAGCGGANDADHHEHNEKEVHEHMEGDEHGHSEGEEAHETMGQEDAEHVYACPMHPEITGKEGDKCSKCGMDLEMVEHEH